MVAAVAGTLSATEVTWYSGAVNTTLADNSAAGSTFTTAGGTWSGSPDAPIDVSVILNISGGYNGDLYGYLVYNDGTSAKTEILLNRVGGGSGSLVASTAGFGGGATTDFASLKTAGVTLADGRSNPGIQTTAAAAGQSYSSDGSSLNTTFTGMAGNGTWTLFLADMSAGDQSTLVSWGLDISVVPEPVTYALGIFGGAMALLVLGCRIARQN